MNLGPTEIVLLLIVMVFTFGPKRIPEIGKSLGEALSSFRKATREEDDSRNTPKVTATAESAKEVG